MKYDWRSLNSRNLKIFAKKIHKESLAFPVSSLKEIGCEKLSGSTADQPFKVYRSRHYLVQLYRVNDKATRVSVSRTEVDLAKRDWKDGITWDTLQWVKNEIGFGDREAVEFYPRNEDVINVANLRHLWVLPEGVYLPFGWKEGS